MKTRRLAFVFRRGLGFGLMVLLLAAGNARAQNAGGPSAREKLMKAAAEKPTPRTADGHPDLTGFWNLPELPASAHVVNGVTYVQTIPGASAAPRGGQPAAKEDPNPPPYKPELAAKVKMLEENETKYDPAFHCKPLGVPRIGPPRQVVQTSELLIFFYQVDIGEGDSQGVGVRLIPVDGRPHRSDVDPMYFGDSIGHWEGDTLVVDVTHLTDDSWLGIGGYFHSTALHVTERYTRKGDTLTYEATAEDPTVLTRPWIMTPQTVPLEDANGMVVEQPPCEERDESHLTDKSHHTRDF